MAWKVLSVVLLLSVPYANACDLGQEASSPAEGAVTELSHGLHETVGQVDLYDANPQPLPADVSEEVYKNLPQKMSLQLCDRDTLVCNYRLINFQCETKGVQGFDPTYTCSYGRNGSLDDPHSKAIYKALMKAGFVSDCNREFLQHCELDPITELNCKSTPTEDPSKQNFSCTIEL